MKTILIIGGNSMLGQKLVKKLLNSGFFVISTYNRNKNNSIKDKNFKEYELNLLDTNNIDKCLNSLFLKYDIDIFIFNSSIRKFGLFIDISMKELNQLYKVNIYSLLYIYKNFLFKYFKNKKKGLLLNIGSLCSILSFPFSQTYCSSKAFQRSMVHGFDMELSKYCIGFKNILFGPLRYKGKVLVNRNMLFNNNNLISNYKKDLNNFKSNYNKKIGGDDINKIVEEIISILKKKRNIIKTDIIIGENSKKLLKENNILYSNNF